MLPGSYALSHWMLDLINAFCVLCLIFYLWSFLIKLFLKGTQLLVIMSAFSNALKTLKVTSFRPSWEAYRVVQIYVLIFNNAFGTFLVAVKYLQITILSSVYAISIRHKFKSVYFILGLLNTSVLVGFLLGITRGEHLVRYSTKCIHLMGSAVVLDRIVEVKANLRRGNSLVAMKCLKSTRSTTIEGALRFRMISGEGIGILNTILVNTINILVIVRQKH